MSTTEAVSATTPPVTFDPRTSLPTSLATIADELSGGMDLRDYYDHIRASYNDLRDYYDDLRAVFDLRHPSWPADQTGMDRWMRDNPGPTLPQMHPLAGHDELEDGIPSGWSIVTRKALWPGMAECEVCGEPLELAAKGAPRRTCSDKCRKALSRQRRAS